MTRPRTAPPVVTFVVAGAQKAGTRALRHFLAQHPQIGLSRTDRVEPHFFDAMADRAEVGDYAAYHAMYDAEALSRPAVGDVTPIYIYDPDCLPRIRTYNPDMKVIVLLREPVVRAYSQWAMQVEKKLEPRRFPAALWHEIRHYRLRQVHPHFSYLHRGLYAGQIARLFDCFPRQQCLVLRSEDLRLHHDATMARILQFLKVDPLPSHKVVVHAGHYLPVNPVLARLLRLFFRREIARLEKLLDWNCRDWR